MGRLAIVATCKTGPQSYAIVRYDQGQVDDVCISGDTFCMEQMDRDQWWLEIRRGDQHTMFGLHWDGKRREIVAIVTEDTIGCKEDTR